MDGDGALPLVGNEAQFSEAIHKKTNPGSGWPDQFGQFLLMNLRNDLPRSASAAEGSKREKSLSQPFFTGVQKLIHYDFLVSAHAGEQVINKKCCKGLFMLDYAQHFF